MSRKLPAEFTELTPFLEKWARSSERERHLAMLENGLEEVRLLHNAVLPQFPSIVAHLNQYPIYEMPPESKALFELTLAFVETAHPIDLNWTTTDIDDPIPFERLQYLGPSGP